MKKLLIIAAVAMAAITTNAAAITWAARNIYVPVATDVAVSQAGIVPTSGDKFATGALVVSLYWVSTEGNVKIGDFATTGAGVIGAQTIGSGTDSDLYKAMVADHGTGWTPQYVFTATYETENGVYVYNGTSSATVTVGNLSSKNVASSAKFDEAGSWTYTANPVPEPTSAMLLLLGVAGLALRRRRA